MRYALKNTNDVGIVFLDLVISAVAANDDVLRNSYLLFDAYESRKSSD
jgi:hypothetical protein